MSHPLYIQEVRFVMSPTLAAFEPSDEQRSFLEAVALIPPLPPFSLVLLRVDAVERVRLISQFIASNLISVSGIRKGEEKSATDWISNVRRTELGRSEEIAHALPFRRK